MKQGFHFGKKCAGVAETTMSGKGANKRDNWRCRACIADNQASTEDESVPVSASLAELSAKIEALVPLKDVISSLVLKVDQLLALKSTVDELHKSMQSAEQSMDFLSKKYEEMRASEAKRQVTIDNLETDVASLRSLVSKQSEEISDLRRGANNAEQYSRLSNMEIHGLPQKPKEDLLSLIADLAQKLEVPFEDCDVETIHRLPAKREGEPVVLVRFVNRMLKEKWISSRAKLRLLVESKDASPMFFCDNLTGFNKQLFWAVKQKCKEMEYKFVWSKNCKIFVRKIEGAPLFRINGFADLDRLVRQWTQSLTNVTM
ncbi:hypothetical protein HPB48_007566 [Haemaphysalis longicornis]|uniref:FP protein C-terminal domain-containing protein n=1 Tax=Haemaphysalis longicornis TaxID=44386 RepID=A0A9J6FCG9_HAELO|nr:hypothetical protein HPB48_007566 [Haemaphysalis longicornis]